jgi:hypothetical protein
MGLNAREAAVSRFSLALVAPRYRALIVDAVAAGGG